MIKKYDFIVVGAGSAGVRAARMAASMGQGVAIIEKSALGGTCVNIGCVPKKIFVYASEYQHAFNQAQGYGWQISGDITHDWQMLVQRKNDEISRLNGIYEKLLLNNNVDIIHGHGAFVNAHDIEIKAHDGSQKTISGDKILIATGCVPTRPNIDGAQYGVVSDDMFFLKKLPKSATIMGGGYIALEFAAILNGLGVEVKVVHRSQLLRHFDQECVSLISQQMQSHGIEFIMPANITKITKDNDIISAYLDNGDIINSELLLFATGRHANINGLGCDNADIAIDDRGYIRTNDDFSTSQAHIYALGDVSGVTQLTPYAIRQAMVLTSRLFGDGTQEMAHEYLPTAIFTYPQFGTVGVSEDAAIKQYGAGNIKIYKTSFRPMKHILGNSDDKILMKLVCMGADDKIIGVHIVGDGAAEMVQCLAISLGMDARKKDFDATMALHPSNSEELVTIRA